MDVRRGEQECCFQAMSNWTFIKHVYEREREKERKKRERGEKREEEWRKRHIHERKSHH